MSDDPLRPRAPSLNEECVATTVDREALHGHLADHSGDDALHRKMLLRNPTLFAAVPVFISRAEFDRMAALITAVESVVAMESFEGMAFRGAPAAALHRFGPRGVFFGYDFHLGAEGPQLIEINTNAGGPLLNLVLAKAQRVCCEVVAQMTVGSVPIAQLEAAFLAMFAEEWRSQRGSAPLRTIAIVDENPPEQFLYPEFLLFQGMLRRAGYDARILGPDALEERGGGLFDGQTQIDLVYNRLTDFYFEREASAPLLRAYAAGGVVVTPHPRAHATFADKRLLAHLSDGEWLTSQGVPEPTRATLVAGIPRTRVLDATSRAQLWEDRGGHFFKPMRGFASASVHHGHALTESTWAQMPDGHYVAQRTVAPSARAVAVHGPKEMFKLDVRAYAYAGEVQLVAARLFQGPTMNLRSVGGGFAPVLVEGERTDGHPFACWEKCLGRGSAGRDPE